jgi:N utilization substance protein A
VVTINRETGELGGTHNGEVMDQAEISGRIGAQTAKQVIIQKIREAERDSLLGEYGEQIGTMINGVVTRNEGPATIVSLGTIEAILPRSEQIPGETHHPNERVRAVIFEVKPQGSRVKVVLSRTRPQLIQRLFEQEIPEIADGVITINGVAREPGHRSKVAVSSSDQRVDCVGACVGVRGNRIKNIVDELAGERIDIVRYSEDAETLIRAALQPAEVDQVLLCDMIGRAIVLVREDQLSLAIGRKGQNVRLASKLCGWDIEIMTNDELEQQIERAVAGFMQIDGMNEELAQRLVEQGYLSYDDLSVIEPDALMEMGSMTEEQVDQIVVQAEALAEQAEKAADEERRRKKAEDAAAAAAGSAPASASPPVTADGDATTTPQSATAEAGSESAPPAEQVAGSNEPAGS